MVVEAIDVTAKMTVLIYCITLQKRFYRVPGHQFIALIEVDSIYPPQCMFCKILWPRKGNIPMKSKDFKSFVGIEIYSKVQWHFRFKDLQKLVSIMKIQFRYQFAARKSWFS